jgi:hypothetical protein
MDLGYLGDNASSERRGGDSLGRAISMDLGYLGDNASSERRGGDSLGRSIDNGNPAFEGFDASMERMTESATLGTYPNPSTGIVNIAWSGFSPEKVMVTNLQGKVVAQLSTENAQQVDLSALPKGLYLLLAIQGDQRLSCTLVLE